MELGEIVVVEPVVDQGRPECSSPSAAPARRISRTRTANYVPNYFDSETLPLGISDKIQRFLRVANEIRDESPRASYMCRFHAFAKAHEIDPSSSIRGVRQLKTALIGQLERDEAIILSQQKQENSVRELYRMYMKYQNVIRSCEVHDTTDRDVRTRAHAIASVLYEVLGDVSPGVTLPVPEIKATIAALRKIRGLPWPTNHFSSGDDDMDLLDWLQCWFRFQEGNVKNQREHLILLLANIHIRQFPRPEPLSELDDRAINELMKRLFKNYKAWCKFLGRPSNLWLPAVHQEVQQYKLLYIALYLLIWGEASNLRFMPECLCYIFHHMAYELVSHLSGAVSFKTGESFTPIYGQGKGDFLTQVITPIYNVVYKESQRSNNGTAGHSQWRNYDDLNEFFWSPDCFQLGWPMRSGMADLADFFSTLPPDKHRTCPMDDEKPIWLGKTNFVEIRSFWHLFRSFDRMWAFLLLALQAMIVMAWHGVQSPFDVLDASILKDMMSIFITSSVINFLRAILDIVFTWKARKSMCFSQKLRLVLKLVAAIIWAILLSFYYAFPRHRSFCFSRMFSNRASQWSCLSPYTITIIAYMTPNAIGVLLFFLPALASCVETSTWKIFAILSWWVQPRLYVGRGMQESTISLTKYSVFWTLLLTSKLLFSYYFEVLPLVGPTKQIMEMNIKKYEWHEFFPEVKNNAGAVVAVWAPVILVYFMDTQIWYAVFCTIFGGLSGVFHHLGEIRTMGTLRTRFHSLPSAFNVHLMPKSTKRKTGSFFSSNFSKASEKAQNRSAEFAQVWNQIITSFRSEDLISNREMDLMIVPISSELGDSSACCPLFLLAAKLSTAVDIAKNFIGTDRDLYKTIKKDVYMLSAVKECYESLKHIFNLLVVGDREKRIMSGIIEQVETSVKESTFLMHFRMKELPILHKKFVQMVDLLIENKVDCQGKLVRLLQDIFEVVTEDMIIHGCSFCDSVRCSHSADDMLLFLPSDTNAVLSYPLPESADDMLLFLPSDTNAVLSYPLPDDSSLQEKIKRLYLLLTINESAMDIPVNLEARRRISFFSTSLFMDMPPAPKVRSMIPFSVITPYYMEEVTFSEEELHSVQDAVSIIFYMQTIYPGFYLLNSLFRFFYVHLFLVLSCSSISPDEWKNFLERIECGDSDFTDAEKMEELRKWASYRGQTLSRTVRGMMYYKEALKLQAFLDMANEEEICKGYDAVKRNGNAHHRLLAQLEGVADMKFTYVVSCQNFGAQKSSGDPRAHDIVDLMIKYPSLRVAYIEEREMGNGHKVYFSVLVKAANNLDQEVYRIQLPGPPIIGEGKPENQNHAIIFTRGEGLQTIDMNQDNYLEEAFKMRNLLQEFLHHSRKRPPTILGMREHIFTGSVSSLAGFMSYQETSFVTIGQRLLANPLKVRFHYGHPDVFDRIFHLTRGGVSKASKVINLSEDIFAGYNSTLRQGNVTYHEYMQVGKGRDLGLNQISLFEAKVANGNAEQSLSRDIYRLGHRFDFFRMLSCYYTTVGFYFSALVTVLGIYVFLYGQLYLVLSGLEKAILSAAGAERNRSLETALASQSFIQLGLLTGLPMLMELGLEKGFRTAVYNFFLMQFQLASVFFTFNLGTKAHYYSCTLLHGGAKYRPTGRRFVVFHASFTENYRLYSRSHFVKGFELVFLLIVYISFCQSYQNNVTYMIVTYSIWFMSLTWLFAPFLFNPSGLEWEKVVQDWFGWNKWIHNQGGIGIHPVKSWESWWDEEHAHLKYSGINGRIAEIVLSFRFFIYQYGLVYHLDIAQRNQDIMVYGISWLVIITFFVLIKISIEGRRRLSANSHALYRLLKAVLFLCFLSILIVLLSLCGLSGKDLFICALAFLPTGWGLLLVAQAVRPLIEKVGIWDSVQVIARSYDYGMGFLLFAPLAVLAFIPSVSEFQTRLLFNQAFSRRLQIQPILKGKRKNKSPP
ncbi:putative callose synthase 8 isoform X3 [Nymphaea colorata]|uniref:putative callose synthase 8 isoform X3 n=1 Tax=Nymphaea colorata TaxID=210225 RepID=UPI00129D8389|nr:putative callose synthase 8 isoform X3 [Nymphaea colorata]